MPVQFPRGKIMGPEDLVISLVDADGNPTNAYEISYALYSVVTGFEVPIGPTDRTPIHPELGMYYASFQIPEDADLGLYRIRWTFKEKTTSPQNVVMEEFKIVVPEVFLEDKFSVIQADMIRRLRILLRDQNPDQYYKFRPPTSEGTINQFNRVFAYVWEDEELIEYMERAVDFVNMWPPETHWNSIDSMVKAKPAWRQMILVGAIAHAAMALSLNWIVEEFSYSIGGISLDIEKSSKYESIKNNAEQQFDKMLEAKTRTVKIIRGLQQSRYGIGVRSAFGPALGNGKLTPRSYLGL
jgi:hypothetical protein